MSYEAVARALAGGTPRGGGRGTNRNLADARLPRAVLRPGASYHGRIDLIAVDLVLAGRRPPSVLDDDHVLYAIVMRPGTVGGKARALGIADGTVEAHMARHGGGDGGGPP